MVAKSPTFLFDRRAHGSENLSPKPRKDFCNKIRQQPTGSLAHRDNGVPNYTIYEFSSGDLFDSFFALVAHTAIRPVIFSSRLVSVHLEVAR
jgi:hypothetical protein